MHRTRLIFVLCVSLSSAAAARSQAPSAALSRELRAHVQAERFSIVTSVRGLPLGVRAGLQNLFGSQTLDIAEPGAQFPVSGEPEGPTRRLVAAGCSYEYCLVYYELSGVTHTWRAALFHWTPEATRFEWGGVAPGGMKMIGEVQKAILSGAIKTAAAGAW